MNIFMPYRSSEESVQALDNKRLCKQILECFQLIKLIESSKLDHKFKSSYLNHPVTQYFKENYNTLVCYAFDAVLEYTYRFGKKHSYENEIVNRFMMIPKHLYVFRPATIFYHEGKDLRSYDPFISLDLFKLKLCKKWINDLCLNRKPKWSERIVPTFFIEYIKLHYSMLEELAQDNETLKKFIEIYKEN